MNTSRLRLLVVLAPLAVLGACAVGPNYVRPGVPKPAAYAELRGWKAAQPQDEAPRGRWWSLYGDRDLDALMDRLNASNQTVAQAEAQYRSAQALVQQARAALFPSVTASASTTRSQSGSARSAPGAAAGAAAGAAPTSTVDSASVNASWEIDLWGRLRRQAENARENSKASAADLAAARLSAQAALAVDYFQLRTTDEQIRLYQANVDGLRRSLQIAQNQFAAGVAGRADVAQAQTQLQSTEASAIDLGIARAQLEHAIAVLIGEAPEDFSLKPGPFRVKIPNIPVDVPSALLERRPDIAANERRVAAANANIGVAESAYFPALTLSGAFGYEGTSWSRLAMLANRVWSAGPAVALSVFDAGARRAATRQAIANYDASVAVYRQTVLGAFQEVEDDLAASRLLNEELVVQDAATKAADESQTIALNQYKSGVVSYLNVVVAQTTALSNERASLVLRGRQLGASVALITSLGGGWNRP